VNKSLFFQKVLIPDDSGCMNWIGAKNNKGYGNLTIKRITHKAHRVSYEIFNGKFDKSLSVCHSCDNPSCVNPCHLFLGTHKENMADMKSKNRNFVPVNIGTRNGGNKLSAYSVKMIRQFIYQGVPSIVLAKEYMVSTAQISRIKNNHKWKINNEVNYVY
jgi:hypothetical protein